MKDIGRIDISVDDVANGHIDHSALHSVILTKDNPTQSMGTIWWDLKDFDGWISPVYNDTKCYPYTFTITEDSSYKTVPGVIYDPEPRHIKIWVNVTFVN